MLRQPTVAAQRSPWAVLAVTSLAVFFGRGRRYPGWTACT